MEHIQDESPDRRAVENEHTRWNFVVIVTECSAFMSGLAWVDPATVLPLFITRLTGSTVLVGLVTFVHRLGYLLPQLPMAAVLGHRPRRAPFLRWGVLLGRAPFFFFAAYLWARGVSNPQLVIWFMMLAYFSTALGNGVVAVPWQDIIAKSIPSWLRGRFFASIHFATAIAVVGIGFAVRWMLGPNGPAFPANYAILFTLMTAFLAISTAGCWLVREPIRPVLDRPQSAAQIIHSLWPMLREHHAFRCLALTAVLGFSLSFATPFYMVNAKSELGVADETAGIYIWTMTFGSAVSSVVWGYLNDRRGPRSVLRGACTFVTLAPLFAVALSAAASSGGQLLPGGQQGIPYLYSIVFLCAGVAFGGVWMGVTNSVFELASHQDRPRYIGMMALLGTPGAFFPLLVGWLLTFLGFGVVFGLFVACAATALYSSWRMPVETAAS